MFPSPTTDSPTRRSLRELMRGALGTALEFATLGEATLDGSPVAPVPSGEPATVDASSHRGPHPRFEHPHRQALVRPRRPRRDGAVPPRVPVCTLTS
jgi:hypothetical protein